MNAQATKIQAAENDLKQLMADVTRAIEKAQQAVAGISSKVAVSPPHEAGPGTKFFKFFTEDTRTSG
jgi:hypothetical protein